MAEYKPNSHRSKEEAAESANNKKVQKVISGKAKTKPNEMRKLSGLFLADDISNVKSYVFSDVLIPAIKNAISDVIIEATTALFGGNKNRSGRSGRANSSPSYRSYYDDRDRPPARSGSSRFDYDDISFDTRADGKRKTMRVNRLVACAFIPNPENKEEVNHKNGNKHDNNVSNLEWSTKKENNIHAVKHGLTSHVPSYGMLGKKNPNAGRKGIPFQIIETGEIFNSLEECEKRIDGNDTCIWDCLHGRQKTHRNYHFKYI